MASSLPPGFRGVAVYLTLSDGTGVEPERAGTRKNRPVAAGRRAPRYSSSLWGEGRRAGRLREAFSSSFQVACLFSSFHLSETAQKGNARNISSSPLVNFFCNRPHFTHPMFRDLSAMELSFH